MTELLTSQFPVFMFLGLFALLISGFPVAFGLAAVGLGFGLIGVALGLFTLSLIHI